MGGIAQTGMKLIENFIPPAGPRRNILFLWPFLQFFCQAQDRGRDNATTATLGLKTIVLTDDPFIEWYNKASGQSPADNPENLLFMSQFQDLLCKVIVSTAFFFTRDLSVYSSIKHILSHSEKVSNVALPILDQVASLPKPRFLQSTHVVVIIFAPAILKLIQMMILYIDPKGLYFLTEPAKTVLNKTAQGLEFFWNLRFSLVCLGISESVFASVFSTIYSRSVDYFFSQDFTKHSVLMLPAKVAPFLKKSLAEDPSKFNYLMNLFIGDLWPTTGFGVGLQGMLASLNLNNGPYNILTLEQLFNTARNLKWNDTFKVFQDHVSQTLLDISAAVKERKISENQAANLKQLALDISLESLLGNDLLLAELDKNDVCTFLKETYYPNATKDEATQVVKFLKKLHDQSETTAEKVIYGFDLGIQWIRSLLENKSISEHFANQLEKLCLKKAQAKLQTKTDEIFKSPLSEIPGKVKAVLVAFNKLEQDHASELKATLKNRLKDYYQTLNTSPEASLVLYYSALNNIKTPTLLETLLVNDENEKCLIELFGTDGLFNQLAKQKDGSLGDDYFVSLELHFNIFNLNFNWYLKNYKQMSTQQREKCEFMLLAQAVQSYVKPTLLLQTPALQSTIANKNLIEEMTNNPTELAVGYAKTSISQLENFNYRRADDIFPIPNKFQFVTYSLPYEVGFLRTEASAKINTWPLTNHLPDKYKNNFNSHQVPSFNEEIVAEEGKKFVNSLPTSNQIRALLNESKEEN